MHHSILMVILGISLLQTASWMARKFITKEVKMNRNSLIIAESILISTVLFSYIFYKTSVNEVLEDFKKITPKMAFYLIMVALSVTGAIVLIFDLIPKVEISKLGPSVSISRIVLLTLVGFFVFGEKLTYKKISAIILMITGVSLLIYEN